MKNLIITLFILANINCYSQIEIGNKIPDFKLWFTDGNTITKNDIQDKVVVFKFWFTSCFPCLADIDDLNTLVKEHKNKSDILFLAPALDRKDIIEHFVAKNRFDFRVAYSSIEASEIFNPTQVYPSYFIVNKKGEFTYIDSGSKKSEFINLRNALRETLKE